MTPDKIQPDAPDAELREWMNAAPEASLRGRLRKALLTAEPAAADSVTVVPVGGTAWIRRPGAAAAVPVSGVLPVSRGAAVRVPAGSRAQLHFPDGSLLLLNGSTDLDLGADNRETARLRSGRVFAWIAPQAGGQFSVATPRGTVSVLGTEFDLSVREGCPLDLIVARGRVRFCAAAGEAVATDTTVGMGQWLSFGPGPATVRPLPSRELRDRTSWARQGRGSGPGGEGGGSGKWIALAAVVLIAGAAWYIHDRTTPATAGRPASPAPASTSPAPTMASVPGRPVTLRGDTATFALPFQPDTRWSMMARSEQNVQGRWVTRARMEFGMKVTKVESDGRARLETLLEKISEYGADGREQPGGRSFLSRIANRPIESWITPQGHIEGLAFVGAPNVEGAAAAFLADFINYNPYRMLPSKPVKPGDEYDAPESGSVIQHPSCTYDHKVRVRYEGVEDRGGRRLARFTYTAQGSVRGAVMGQQSTGQRMMTVRMDERRTEGSGSFWVDMNNGHVVRRVIDEKRRTSVSRVISDGPRVISTQPINNETEEARITVGEDWPS